MALDNQPSPTRFEVRSGAPPYVVQSRKPLESRAFPDACRWEHHPLLIAPAAVGEKGGGLPGRGMRLGWAAMATEPDRPGPKAGRREIMVCLCLALVVLGLIARQRAATNDAMRFQDAASLSVGEVRRMVGRLEPSASGGWVRKLPRTAQQAVMAAGLFPDGEKVRFIAYKTLLRVPRSALTGATSELAVALGSADSMTRGMAAELAGSLGAAGKGLLPVLWTRIHAVESNQFQMDPVALQAVLKIDPGSPAATNLAQKWGVMVEAPTAR